MTVVAICALGSIVFFFSVLLSVFRSKHEGYPYRYTRYVLLLLLLFLKLITDLCALIVEIFATSLWRKDCVKVLFVFYTLHFVFYFNYKKC